MGIEGRNEKVEEYRATEDGRRVVARITGMIVARMGGPILLSRLL
jgi:hypothetical protein